MIKEPGGEGRRRGQEAGREKEDREETIMILERLPLGTEDRKLTLSWMLGNSSECQAHLSCPHQKWSRFLPVTEAG